MSKRKAITILSLAFAGCLAIMSTRTLAQDYLTGCALLPEGERIELFTDTGEKFDEFITSMDKRRNVYAIADIEPGLDGRYLLVESQEVLFKDQKDGTVLGYVDPDWVNVIDSKYCGKVPAGAVYWPGDQL